MRRILTLCACAAGFLSFFSSQGWTKGLPQEHFPVDADMRIRVDFWKRVYTEISSGEAFLHDEDDLRVIYRKVAIADQGPRQRRKFVKDEKRRIGDVLRSIVKKKRDNLTAEESEMLKAVGDATDRRILEMARNVRCQQGLTDRYYEGLVRSTLYIDQIRQIFREAGMPEELGYLPHVESSFNYRAYSKVGAAGIWQFMRSTARLYNLKLTYVLDERRDPLAATRAAARFLRDSYAQLGAWPLALTAYNHGPKSIAKAVRTLGTKDLSKIVDSYDGRRFGFASKNFYATFVATSEISMEPEKYFPKVVRSELPPTSEIPLNRSLTIRQISKATGISEDDLQTYNRALRPVAFKANVYLPKGYKLIVPKTDVATIEDYGKRFGDLKGAGPEDLKSGGVHIVSRGESLYEVAGLYRVNLADLIMLNQIENPSRVQPGTKLRIPDTSKAGPAARPVLIAQVEPNKGRGGRGRNVPAPAPSQQAANAPSDAPVEPFLPQTPTPEPHSDTQVVAASRSDLGKHVAIADAALAPESARDALEEGDVEALVTAQEEILRRSPVTRSFRTLLDEASNPRPGAPRSLHERLMASRAPIQPIAPETLEKQGEKEEKKQETPNFDATTYALDAVPTEPGFYLVTVEPDETLGHMADWARTPMNAIRQLNKLKGSSQVRLGQKLRIPIKEGNLMQFNLARLQYHQSMEEDLYASYRVAGIVDYVVRRGDSMERITRRLEVPYWLLRKYQPEELSGELTVGQVLKVPQLAPISSEVPPPGLPAPSDPTSTE